jgi:hypothetical protein
MNWKGFGRKQSWSNSRHCPNICLEGLRKIASKPQDFGITAEVCIGYLPNMSDALQLEPICSIIFRTIISESSRYIEPRDNAHSRDTLFEPRKLRSKL